MTQFTSLPDWNLLPAPLLCIDKSGALVEANRAARKAFGLKEEIQWEQLIPNEVERLRLAGFLESVDLKSAENAVIEVQAKDNRWIEIRPGVLHGSHRWLLIVDRTSQNAAIDSANDQCVHLERLLQLSRQDRQLIAYDIHDGFSQDMTAAQMFLEAGLTAMLSEDPDTKERAEVNFRDAAKYLRRSIEGSRSMINGLRPIEMENNGLTESLARLIINCPIETSRVTLKTDGPYDQLDTTLALSIFRMVQETLNNIWKHADADQVLVSLHQEGGEIHVVIEDDGVGFTPETADNNRHGLRSLQNRAITFGGACSIRSQPGAGCKVTIIVPLILHE